MQTQNLVMTGREDWRGRTGKRLGAEGQPQAVGGRSELLGPKRLPGMPEVSEPKSTEHQSETQSPLGLRLPSAFPARSLPAYASQAPGLPRDRPSAHPSCGPFQSTKSGCWWICLNHSTHILLHSDLPIKTEYNQTLELRAWPSKNNFQALGRTSTASNSETYRHLSGTPTFPHQDPFLGSRIEGPNLAAQSWVDSGATGSIEGPLRAGGSRGGNQEALPALLALRCSGAPLPETVTPIARLPVLAGRRPAPGSGGSW